MCLRYYLGIEIGEGASKTTERLDFEAVRKKNRFYIEVNKGGMVENTKWILHIHDPVHLNHRVRITFTTILFPWINY